MNDGGGDEGRYRKAGEIAGQVAIAALVLIGFVGSACLLAAFVLAAMLVSS